MLVSLPKALVESSRVCSERAVAGAVNSSPAMPPCASCSLSERCLPGELAIADAGNTDKHLLGRRRIRAGERLYSEGEVFECLFEVRSGNLKSSLTLADGQERVSAFHMAGERIGFDGIANGHHLSSATALEDSEVCAVSYATMTELATRNTDFQRTLLQNLSRETVHEFHSLVRLSSLSSRKRVAAFLLNLSQRMSARGYSPNEFHLRMSRTDIASYLGLTHETVCRNFSAFQRLGLLEVDQRHIRIVDLPGLRLVSSDQIPK